MAAVSVPPSPHTLMNMSNRRPPLSNIPNAANSPCRVAVAAAGTAFAKRARPSSNMPLEMGTTQGPATKKAMLSKDRVHSPSRSPSRRLEHHTQSVPSQQSQQSQQSQTQRLSQETEAPLLTRRVRNAPTMANLDRKLQDVRDKTRRAIEERWADEKLENVRQWQKHYRKAFPQFVFYFESVPNDVRAKCLKQAIALGATEAKFFSREVTHVVTTRSIPAEAEVGSLNETTSQPSRSQPKTINPSLLERSSRMTAASTQPSLQPGQAEANVGRRTLANGQFNLAGAPIDLRKQQAAGGALDVLARAKELGMKIWALEKFQRMMAAMFETDTGTQTQHLHHTRSTTTGALAGLTARSHESNLAQLLRNERRNGPADRDRTVATQEIIPFKGPFLYVHDMDEKVRPILVRDYPKVDKREEGIWPQFRSVHEGRCPFLNETDLGKRPDDKEKACVEQQRRARPTAADDTVASRTRAAVAVAQEPTRMQPPARTAAELKRRLAETEENIRPSRRRDHLHGGELHQEAATKPMKAPQLPAVGSRSREHHAETLVRSNFPPGHAILGARFVGGEPLASGVQPSNITSAIRSQMISSTAATGPGAKAGTNKEVFSLKRKILEKQGAPSVNAMQQQQQQPPPVFGETTEQQPRVVRSTRAQMKPRAILEEEPEKLKGVESDDDEGQSVPSTRATTTTTRNALVSKVERDPKPGYCENCRDKFDDFDTHIASRNHRKFATDPKNWLELDHLLSKLHGDELEM